MHGEQLDLLAYRAAPPPEPAPRAPRRAARAAPAAPPRRKLTREEREACPRDAIRERYEVQLEKLLEYPGILDLHVREPLIRRANGMPSAAFAALLERASHDATGGVRFRRFWKVARDWGQQLSIMRRYPGPPPGRAE